MNQPLSGVTPQSLHILIIIVVVKSAFYNNRGY